MRSLCWRPPRRRTPPKWITLLFPIAYLVMISSSPKVAERYLLPVSAMVPLLAALGTGEIARTLGSSGSTARTACGYAVSVGLLGWAAYAELPAFHRAWEGFQHDDPSAVAEWVKTNLPLGAIIAEDHRVNLSVTKADGLSTNARVPQKVLDASFAPDLGTFDELRAKGVGDVAVCRQNYGRYVNDETKPQAGVKTELSTSGSTFTRGFSQRANCSRNGRRGPSPTFNRASDSTEFRLPRSSLSRLPLLAGVLSPGGRSRRCRVLAADPRR